MTNKLEMTEEQQQEWVREHYLKATKYLAQKGLVAESVADTESRYLIPLMAVWKINLLDKTKVWVICGDLPTDHLVLEENESARNVLQEQLDYAKLLMTKAEGLYQLYAKDEIWA